jgi:hypothetical protein
MKPSRVFLLCLVVAASVLALSFIYPSSGLTLLGCRLDFMNVRDLFKQDKVAHVDISKIISDTVLTETKISQTEIIRNDSLHIQHNQISLALFKKFYSKIKNARENAQLVRVLHYGDSQIEADRISGTLRENLQKKFGGSGVGIVPVTEVSDARCNVFVDASRNWQRDEVNVKLQKFKALGGYGILGSVYEVADPGNETWIKIRANKQSSDLQKKMLHVKLLYSGKLNCSAKIDTSKEKNISESCVGGFSALDIPTCGSSACDIKLQFNNVQNTKLYGIALDGESGVTVDNVSLRGSSGTEFTKIDSALMKKQLEDLNVGMIVFQFGVNVVPYVIKDYSYYQKLFYSQLAYFRKIAPDAAILVVGVSDMSRREKGVYQSYPNIEKIRAAMKNAAFEAGCAYWDLYEVMGGKNSMPLWVNAKPTLANKDYTHFNNRGAEIVGLKLYNALMEDYAKTIKPDINKKMLAKNK